jgi:hypothetical protein
MLGAGDYGGVGLETELMPIDGIAMTAMIAITVHQGLRPAKIYESDTWYQQLS